MTLGEFLKTLNLLDKTLHVEYEFARLRPTTLDSYRGYYDRLALGYKYEGVITVGELIAEAQSAIGKTFTGYKGGEYVMDTDTLLYAANFGEWSRTKIRGVSIEGDRVVILTEREE